MRFILLYIGVLCMLYADINETKPLDLDIALITKRDLRIQGYKIGQDAARVIRRLEGSSLMQDQAPVDGTSFCNQASIEAYALNYQCAQKLAEDNNDEIFRQWILKGCTDYMNGRITTHEEFISSETIDSTDINSIQRMLDKAQGQPSVVDMGKGPDSIDAVLKQVEEGFEKNKHILDEAFDINKQRFNK